MKKIVLALAFVSSLFVTSCNSDDSNSVSYGESTGNYWPMAVNNTWVFGSDIGNSELKIIGSTVINGTTYYELSDQADNVFGIQNWVAKKGATYLQKTADSSVNQEGITMNMQGYEIPIFKDDLEANTSWNGNLSSKITYSFNGQTTSTTAKIKYTGTILEKNSTVVLNGITYPNVIKTKTIVEMKILEQTVIIDLQYWFAKDVGPIWENTSYNGTTQERALINHILY